MKQAVNCAVKADRAIRCPICQRGRLLNAAEHTDLRIGTCTAPRRFASIMCRLWQARRTTAPAMRPSAGSTPSAICAGLWMPAAMIFCSRQVKIAPASIGSGGDFYVSEGTVTIICPFLLQSAPARDTAGTPQTSASQASGAQRASSQDRSGSNRAAAGSECSVPVCTPRSEERAQWRVEHSENRHSVGCAGCGVLLCKHFCAGVG